MKKGMTILAVVTAAAGLLALGYLAGSRERPSVAKSEAARHGGIYHCPMHPQIVSDKPGQCPICQMTLVKNVDETRAKRTIYRSTMKPNEVSDHPGNDSMGMAMVPEEAAEPSLGVAPPVEGLAPLVLSARKRQFLGARTVVA